MTFTIVINTLLTLGLWFLFWFLLLLLRHAIDIKKIFIEPILKYPVVIFESDDWGTGPLNQQQALAEIDQLLTGFIDEAGNHPVMTVGLILAEPDTSKISATNCQTYYKRTLTDSRYHQIIEILQEGVTKGVFAIHLHGMEHFWPPALMQSAHSNSAVKQWLLDSHEYQTEKLPSELQSRWVNSSCLPSATHSEKEICQAIDEEIALYQTLFGKPPTIVVPPTFVWTDIVEQAYVDRGIETLVTPGRQCVGRGINSHPVTNGRVFFNGQENKDGLLFLVRNNYFEPSMGHKAATILPAITDKTKCGRPALLEMHRFNFINTLEDKQTSLDELRELLQLIIAELPDCRFLSSEQLASIYRKGTRNIDSEFIMSSPKLRYKVIIARIKLLFQFNRVAKYSGINLLLKLV